MKSTRIHVGLILSVLLLTLAGCGGGTASNPSDNAAQPTTAQQTSASPSSTTLTVGAEPIAVTVRGIMLNFGTAALTQQSTVTLTVTPAPPTPPPNDAYHPIGPFLQVDLGNATIQGVVTFTFPNATPTCQLWACSNTGQYVLLENHVTANGTATGTLAFSPDTQGGTFSVGLVESPYIGAPPHQAWGTWNGYVFQPAPQGGTGTFSQIIAQGRLIGGAQLPNLGARPVVYLHGLGSSIRGGTFNASAQYQWENSGATCILGFEYDTLDAVQSNGVYLAQALNLFASNASTPPNWSIVAHSMGTLVTRSAIEQPGPAVEVGAHNRAVLMCGPHLGSPLVNHLQDRNVMGDLLTEASINKQMDFFNVNGERCSVANNEAGLNNLRTDSPYLAALNVNAANHHPHFAYFTMAGNKVKTDSLMYLVYLLFGIKLDDGVVDVASANFSGLGQLQASVLPFDHLSVNIPRSEGGAGDISFPEISTLLNAPTPALQAAH